MKDIDNINKNIMNQARSNIEQVKNEVEKDQEDITRTFSFSNPMQTGVLDDKNILRDINSLDDYDIGHNKKEGKKLGETQGNNLGNEQSPNLKKEEGQEKKDNQNQEGQEKKDNQNQEGQEKKDNQNQEGQEKKDNQNQ
ncbi:MAG: hypothetical protein K6E10_10850, partial [Eubacterium sp.]|nr:hypothetical protein [Eubacterium sp.]